MAVGSAISFDEESPRDEWDHMVDFEVAEAGDGEELIQIVLDKDPEDKSIFLTRKQLEQLRDWASDVLGSPALF